MRSSLELHNCEAVQSGNVCGALGCPCVEKMGDSTLLEILMQRLGGPNAVVEQLTTVLERGAIVGQEPEPSVDEDSLGYCYLRLFDRVEHRDAKQLGPRPTVADVRRFSNRRADPFGTRNVNVTVELRDGERLAHVSFCGGTSGLRPVAALAALAKDCRVGGESVECGGVVTKRVSHASLDKHCFVHLRRLREVLGGGPDVVGTPWLKDVMDGGYAFIPNGLPFNVPDGARYPYARYNGLRKFVVSLSNPESPQSSEARQYLLDIGANPGETQTDAFWVKAFPTSSILTAYFKLTADSQQKFVQIVTWARDPVPGRPGGTQTPPPDWPSAIPTPVTHSMIWYAGIADWVAGLNDPWPEVCRMALFGIHEPFDPVWWSDYHKTVDVYAMYTRVPQWYRMTFLATVYWIPDPGPNPGLKGPIIQERDDEPLPLDDKPVEGYCYLSLFRPERRATVRKQLGRNPWAASVAATLFAAPQYASGGTFAFTVCKHVDNIKGLDFQQGHVEAAPDGISALEVINLCVSAVRLGATTDLNALMNLQGPDPIAAQPSVFPMVPVGGGAGTVLSFNVFTIVGKAPTNYPDVTFNLLREPAFSLLLGAFESVQLERANFTIQVSTGSTNLVYAAICGPDQDLVTLENWLSTHINTVVHGSDQGYVDSTLTLPSVHPFEKELRAISTTGNPIPTFRFSFAGTANGTGVVKGSITVRVRGQYALGHVRFGATKSTKSHVSRIVSSLPQTVLGANHAPSFGAESEDDDDDSDGEPARPARSAQHVPAATRPVGPYVGTTASRPNGSK